MATQMAEGLASCKGDREALIRYLNQFRQVSESDKHWTARRQFLVKHVWDYEVNTDQLLSLSMVWTNHVFMKCRYSPEIMRKVLDMAEGIDIGEMPSFELVPGATANKRPSSSNGGDVPVKKPAVSRLVTRPRFEPVHFVCSSGTEEKENEKKHTRSDMDSGGERASDANSRPTQTAQDPCFQNTTPYVFDSGTNQEDCDAAASTSGFGLQNQDKTASSNFMTKTQQDYAAKYEAHHSKRSESSQSKRVEEIWGSTPASSRDVHRGLGFAKQEAPEPSGTFNRTKQPAERSSHPSMYDSPKPVPVSSATIEEKQRLIIRVASIVCITYADPTTLNSGDIPNYNFILSRSIQACKTNPEYFYISLKEIPPADLPKNRKLPTDGYACELRCQRVYLATGYSGSKNGARDRASEQAVKLFLKPVEVRVVRRKFKHGYIDDLVVCQTHAHNLSFPPALRNPEEKPPSGPRGHFEPDPRKHWSTFVIVDNAHDAICILNNSAAFNRMKIDYKFNNIPNTNTWQCSVYLQDEFVARANGNKKSSKHAAAEEALRKLRQNQPATPQFPRSNHHSDNGGRHHQSTGRKRQLSELVILENSDNAICIINDTAQFNKMAADYRFVVMPDHRWKCEVYLEGQFVAAGIGPKKIVKHIAAEEALAKLRQTQAVVKSNLRKEGNEEAISRNQIQAHSSEEAMKQEIKEDNIGNQLLRKMGWKGGGLGREGEGIAEPIKVKEQFSREGLGLDMDKGGNRLNKRDIEEIIRNYACSERQDDLRFSTELNNDERKQIHQMSQKYGLRSKSYGQAKQRFLIVSRKVQKEQLIGQLLQEGQVGRYELVKPQARFQ
ncbi:NF-kappa-B-repressing factor-like [Acipenser ruthenus]|uniref:NF-kappa-B-repressing factor-like n=1 Tax=Acipenser ruthenus TaxID=7906 RepID=UPI0027415B9B|nr:NF-kappa-B-repressing factor-like [Acipenser ruthenus]